MFQDNFNKNNLEDYTFDFVSELLTLIGEKSRKYNQRLTFIQEK